MSSLLFRRFEGTLTIVLVVWFSCFLKNKWEKRKGKQLSLWVGGWVLCREKTHMLREQFTSL